MCWSLADGGDPYAIAQEEVGRYRQAPLEDLPPFAGGAVGFFGYDLVRTVEPLGDPNPDPLGLPDMALMLSDVLVVFDHLKHTVTVLANVYADDGRARRGRNAAAVEAIADVPPPSRRPGPALARRRPPGPGLRAEHDARAVRGQRRADHRVRPRGRRLPGGATAALLVGPVPVEPFSIYARPAHGQPEPVHVLPRLRGLPGSPARAPSRCSRSRGRRVSTRPIAGTRPRGATRRGGPAHRRRAARGREGAPPST